MIAARLIAALALLGTALLAPTSAVAAPPAKPAFSDAAGIHVETAEDGFMLSCQDRAEVSTPGFYSPRSTHAATATGPFGTQAMTLTADAGGRLHLGLDCGGLLGPVVVAID